MASTENPSTSSIAEKPAISSVSNEKQNTVVPVKGTNASAETKTNTKDTPSSEGKKNTRSNNKKQEASTTTVENSPPEYENLNEVNLTTEGQDANPSSSSEEKSDNPYIELLNKRLRYLTKRQRQIERIEATLQNGQQINDEQKETLKNKSAVLTAIRELTGLCESYAEIHKSEKQKKAKESQNAKKEQKANHYTAPPPIQQPPQPPQPPQPTKDVNDILKKVVTLLVVTNIFDDSSEGVALRSKFIQNEKTSIKSVEDFDTICNFKDTILARGLKYNSTRDHLLEQSLRHIDKFISKSTESTLGNTSYANLLQQVDEIWSSLSINELFTPPKIEPLPVVQPVAISATINPSKEKSPSAVTPPAEVLISTADVIINFINDSKVIPENQETLNQQDNQQTQEENEDDNKTKKPFYRRRGNNRYNNNRNRNYNNNGDYGGGNNEIQEDGSDNFQQNTRGGYRPRKNYNNNNNYYRRQNQNGDYYNNNGNYRQNYNNNRQKFNTNNQQTDQPTDQQTDQPTNQPATA
jgi:hypothetical protein